MAWIGEERAWVAAEVEEICAARGARLADTKNSWQPRAARRSAAVKKRARKLDKRRFAAAAMSLAVEPLAVDASKASVLNSANADALGAVLGDTGSSVALRSDADEQLLLYVPFPSAVKLHSLAFTAPPSHAPRTLKVFINKPHMTFNDVEGMCCTQAFEVSPGQTQGTPILTKYVNFQFVTSVTLFLDKGEDDELDDEVSAISKLQFFGSVSADTNMKEFKKVG